jgi:hypothetical protein
MYGLRPGELDSVGKVIDFSDPEKPRFRAEKARPSRDVIRGQRETHLERAVVSSSPPGDILSHFPVRPDTGTRNGSVADLRIVDLRAKIQTT